MVSTENDAVMEPPDEIESAVARIKARAARRRADGDVPQGLEEQLDRHFRDLTTQMVNEQRTVLGLEDAVRAFDEAPVPSRTRIAYDSRFRLGTTFHRAWGALSARQTEGVLHQLREHSDLVRSVVDRTAAVVESLAVHGHPDTDRRLATLADRVSQLERRVEELERGGST